MAGLTGILEIAERALSAQRAGIDVASHNIANASTDGYTRQRINLQATEPLKEPYGLLGTGVVASSIQRIREGFVDQQVRNTNQYLGKASEQDQILSQVEAAVNEPSDAGLGEMITKLFTSFQDLSVSPEEPASRNAVLQAGTMMTDTFHQLTTSMDQLKRDMTLNVQSRVDEVNRLIKEVYDVGQRIITLQASGVDPNDAKDLRDNELDELSKLVDIKVNQDSNGSTLVSIGGSLIESSAGYEQLKVDDSGAQVKLAIQNSAATVDVKSGEIGGILEMLNTTIPGYQSQLDSLASAMITRVNAIHSAGSGIGNPPPTGNDFFTGTDARSIAVNPVIVSNVNAIASSSDGAPGNNDVAVALGNVSNELLMNNGSSTISQYYNGLVSDIGASIQTAKNTESSQNLVLTQLQNQRNSISGVSIDEEMVSVIQFQRNFEAASKVINTVNQMFQSILDMV